VYGTLKTDVRRKINGLIKELKLDMSFEELFDICSVILFWLLVASAYDLVLSRFFKY
jgi:hypothetical protein